MKRIRRTPRRFRYYLPSVLSAIAQVTQDYDVTVVFVNFGTVSITRHGAGTAILHTLGVHYSLNTPGVPPLGDAIATEQVKGLISQTVLTTGGGLFAGQAREVDEIFDEMSQYLVAPIAVPASVALKFPKKSEFVRRWVIHHNNLGTGYPPNTI